MDQRRKFPSCHEPVRGAAIAYGVIERRLCLFAIASSLGCSNPSGPSSHGGSAGGGMGGFGGAFSTGGLSAGGSGGLGAGGSGTGGLSTGGSSADGGGGTGGAMTAGAAGLGGAGGAQNTSGLGGGGGGGMAGTGNPDHNRVLVSAKPIPVDGASRVDDAAASDGYSVGLSGSGQGAELLGVPAASKLAVRYGSVSVGTVSVMVNDQVVRTLNVHSTGALTGSFIHAIIDLAIPDNASLKITRSMNDVAVNIDRLIVGHGNLGGLPPDIWNLPPLQAAPGPYAADWEELGRAYSTPEWWREAKLGAWSHWDPQSMPEQGDWYSRKMYQEGDPVYAHHVSTFGHPSEYGYKDVCNEWVIDRWDPESLMDLYVEMGAHFFMAMGVHHDNYDCWDSAYQPWNSVRVGPKVDIVGTWERVARERGLRFGIGFHNTPGRTWGQFMTVRYTSDSQGTRQGDSYDALQTIRDGSGLWWDGMDPVDLYGPVHEASEDPLASPFADQFMWRVDDAISKYHPDMIYFDDHAGDSQVDLGVRMGLGRLAPTLVANYYNKSLSWNQGKMEAVINLKGVGGQYNSFQNSPELLPFVERALVRSTEAIIESEISPYPFQTETTIQDWHYRTGQSYIDARSLIQSLMQNVSRNGSMLLNLTQRGRGDLDPALVTIARDIGAWLRANGEAVYGSRPFEVHGDTAVAYTRNAGKVYATLLGWNGGPVTLAALRSGGRTLGTVSRVELLGGGATLTFTQNTQGLTVTPSGAVAALPGISNQQLASQTRVLRITHDKGWANDDDPGTAAPGWLRKANLGNGDYNDDLTTSDTPGLVWSSTFMGSSVSLYAPKEPGAGSIEVQIDGATPTTVNLSGTGARMPQQLVSQVTGLTTGEHVIKVTHRGAGPVAVDAIVVQ